MNQINIQTIPHSQQRYETPGDYYFEKDSLDVQFRISELSDWRYEACITVHELVEFFIVRYQGINFEQIDKFDKTFERARKKGNHDEPGDDNFCPYHFAHCIASGVERIFAAVLGIKWKEYETEVNRLSQ